jgi:hypothetical protein
MILLAPQVERTPDRRLGSRDGRVGSSCRWREPRRSSLARRTVLDLVRPLVPSKLATVLLMTRHVLMVVVVVTVPARRLGPSLVSLVLHRLLLLVLDAPLAANLALLLPHVLLLLPVPFSTALPAITRKVRLALITEHIQNTPSTHCQCFKNMHKTTQKTSKIIPTFKVLTLEYSRCI